MASSSGRSCCLAPFSSGWIERAGWYEIDDVKVGSKCRVDFTTSIISQTAGQRLFDSPTNLAKSNGQANKIKRHQKINNNSIPIFGSTFPPKTKPIKSKKIKWLGRLSLWRVLDLITRGFGLENQRQEPRPAIKPR